MTIPAFSRVEIRTAGKSDLASAASELRRLADDLDDISTRGHEDGEAIVLAHHRIRETSKKLRFGHE